jgi:hypothetical protein
MDNFRPAFVFALAVFIVFSPGCKKNDDSSNDLARPYSGELSLEYSKGFPQFSVTVKAGITVARDRTVTFGAGNSQPFDSEDIYYENQKPVTKVRMKGTLTFHEAKGESRLVSGAECILVLAHTSVAGQMTVWAWDDELGWVQVLDTPYSYEDTYGNGQLQFSLDYAVLNGSYVKKTVPDLQGNFTYGYLLKLVVVI